MKAIIEHEGKKIEIEISLTKEQLEELAPKKKKKQKATDRIKTFEDALEDQDISEADFSAQCKGMDVDEIAFKKLKIITKSLNEDWTPNFSDSNEYKYFPYFKMVSGGFSYSSYDTWLTTITVSARLLLKSIELCEYIGTQFEAEYKDYLTK